MSLLFPCVCPTGQVKHIDLATRLIYAELILLLADDDTEGVVEKYKQMGMRTQRMDPHILWCLAAFWNDRDTPDVTKGMYGPPCPRVCVCLSACSSCLCLFTCCVSVCAPV